MERSPTMPRALGLAIACALLIAAPALAQDGSRFRVLVPNFERIGDGRGNFGRDVANELRKLIDGMATHASVDSRALRDALRRVNVRENDLDCIKSRQLAVQMDVALVLCGTFEQGAEYTVTASLINARSGDAFDVESFRAPDARGAAGHIFTEFQNFVGQLRMTAICLDYLGSSQWENALQNCDQALEINRQSVPALYGRARALLELERLEESLEAHQAVLALNEVHQDALLTAGIVAARLQQQDLSRSYFNQYLELNPGSVDVRLRVANDLAQAGDPEGALRIAQEGIDNAPDNLTLVEYAGHYAMTAAQRRDEQSRGANGSAPERSAEAVALFEQALRYYEQVFEQKGAEAEATMLRNMMVTLNQLDRGAESVQLGERIVSVKGDDASLWAVYADALQRAGQTDRAIAALDSVVARDPDYANINARRGMWLIQSGQNARGREALQLAVERGELASDDVARNVFAWAYNNRREQYDAVMELYGIARGFATEAQTRAMIAFWTGWSDYQRGMRIQQPQTVESARQSLPFFQRAVENFRQSGPWAQTQPSVNLQQVIDAAEQYIEIQEALIRRGR